MTSRSGTASAAARLVQASANQAMTRAPTPKRCPIGSCRRKRISTTASFIFGSSLQGQGSACRQGSSIPHSRNACASRKTVGRNPNEGENDDESRSEEHTSELQSHSDL